MGFSKPYEINQQDRIIYINAFPVTRVQDISATPAFNATDHTEMGAQGVIESIAELITTDVTLNTLDWGSTDTMAKIMGEKAATPVINTTAKNTYVISQEDFSKACVDISVAVREATATAVQRTSYYPNSYLKSFDFTYNVDGVATENYTFTGDCDEDFIGKYADLRVAVGTIFTSSGFTCSGLFFTGYSGYYISKNNQVVTSTGIVLTTMTSGTHVYAAGLTSSWTSTDRAVVVYYKTTQDTWATKKSAALLDVPGLAAIMGRQIFIYLGDSTITTGSTDKTLRLQSLRINGPIGRRALKELGNARNVTQTLETPLKFTVTAESAESDLELYAKLVGGTTWTAWQQYIAQSDISVSGVHLESDLFGQSCKVYVNIYKERSSSPTTLLKQIVMSGLKVTGKPNTAAVGGRATMSFDLTGSYITVSGTGNDPLA